MQSTTVDLSAHHRAIDSFCQQRVADQEWGREKGRTVAIDYW